MRVNSNPSQGTYGIQMTEMFARIDEEEAGVESRLIEQEPDPERGTDDKDIAHSVPEKNVNKI